MVSGICVDVPLENRLIMPKEDDPRALVPLVRQVLLGSGTYQVTRTSPLG